jgi:hypothetical protein
MGKGNRILCYSVRLETLTGISEKAYKAHGFDGSTAILPKSMVFGQDWDVQKSDAYWIAAFILEKEDCKLQYSHKKQAWFDRETGRQLPTYTVERHVPAKVEPKTVEADASLTR